MEMEYFVPPAEAEQWFAYWLEERFSWYLDLGIPRGPAAPAPPRAERAVPLLVGHRRRRVPLPVGLGRARGHRQPHRLRPARPTPRRRGRSSSTTTRRPTSATCPYVIEPAAGATRTMMAFLLAAYDEDEVGGEARTVLRLHPRLAPYQVGRAAAVEEGDPRAPGPRGARAAPAPLHVRLRHHPVDRQALPPPGRGRARRGA